MLSVPAFCQTKLGFKFAPTISMNRTQDDIDTLQISNNGSAIKMLLGPIADIYIGEKYYFSTGLLFATKRAGLKVTNTQTNANYKEHYKLHYIQIPATIKMYTNEVALDTRIYLQFGGNVEFKTFQDGPDSNIWVSKFGFADLSAQLGAGVEYYIGVDTIIFGGIEYQRGILNVAKDTYRNKDFVLKNDLLGLAFGVKF